MFALWDQSRIWYFCTYLQSICTVPCHKYHSCWPPRPQIQPPVLWNADERNIQSVWIVYTHTCAIMHTSNFQTYFPAFEACVREGRGASIMCSYNAVNGVPSCANDLFQNQVVRDQWGFQGFIVSGCGVAVLLSDWLFEIQRLWHTPPIFSEAIGAGGLEPPRT